MYANDNKGQLPYRVQNGYSGLLPPTMIFSGQTGFPVATLWAVCLFTPGPAISGHPHCGELTPYLSDLNIWGCPAVGAPPISDRANVQGWYQDLFCNYQMFWGGGNLTNGFSVPDFQAYNCGAIRPPNSMYNTNNYTDNQNMPSTIVINHPSESPLMQDVVSWDPSGGFAMANHARFGSSGGLSTVSGSPTPTPSYNPSDSTGGVSTVGLKLSDAVAGANVLFWDGHVSWLAAPAITTTTPSLKTTDCSTLLDEGWFTNANHNLHVMSGPGPWRCGGP
jgi:prepilin-type processing-associated H-X9-DG protein